LFRSLSECEVLTSNFIELIDIIRVEMYMKNVSFEVEKYIIIYVSGKPQFEIFG